MSGWLPLEGGALHERAIAAVVAAVLALFVLTLLFALLVLLLRVRHVGAQRRREGLDARWRGPLLGVLGGETPEARLVAAVEPGEELSFLSFLLPFARRVKGEESLVLRRLAEPCLPRVERELGRRSAELRAVAVQLLGAFGLPAYAPRVVAALDDPSPYVAMTAAQALARPEQAEHGPALAARLWRFTSWSVELLSAMLARMGPAVAPAARAVLEDAAQPLRARAAAADALRRLNDPGSAEPAARVLRDLRGAASADALPAAALRLLGQVGHGAHTDAILPWLDAADPRTRASAVGAYAALVSEPEVASLASRLDDPSPAVAYETASALIRAGHARLVEAVAVGQGPAALVARQALAERRPR